MAKKSEEKTGVEMMEGRDFVKLWANNSNEIFKLWSDSNLKMYKPWIEFIGEKSSKITDLSMNTAPKYKEFYEDWMKTYKSTYGKVFPTETPSPKEALENFVKCADESNKVYTSWITEFGENSKKTADVLNNGIDPAKYRDVCDSWIKSYEKIFDDMNEHPAIKCQRDIIENYTGMPDIYSEPIAKMTKQMKDLYTRLYMPSDTSIKKFSEELSKLSRSEINPDTYREFYELWANTYKESFSRMFDPQTMKPSKELLDDLKESMNISIDMFKSWEKALEKMSAKLESQSKMVNDIESFKEFFNLQIKMYEKIADDIFEGIPLVSPLKEMMEPIRSAFKIYSETSVKISKMWLDSITSMASAQKV